MKRLSPWTLGQLLILANVGLVGLAVLCVVEGAVSRLDTLANEQALTRVEAACAAGLREIDAAGEETASSVRLLSEDPALERLLRAGDLATLPGLLETFLRRSRISGCAVLLDGRAVASAGVEAPWEQVVALAAKGRDHFIAPPLIAPARAGAPLALGSHFPLASLPQASVVAVRVLDEGYERLVSSRVGLAATIRARSLGSKKDDPRDLIRARAVDDEAPAADRLDSASVYLGVAPLRDPAGQVVGLVETELPAASIAGPVRGLERSLLILSIGAAALSALFSVLIGRRLVVPLRGLTAASDRIGRGDLATPVARAGGAEIGALAETMEKMRAGLLGLTAELRRRQAEAEGILLGIVEGVFAVDRERRIRYLNPQAAALLKVDPASAIGRFCGNVLNPQGPGGVRPCEDACPIIHARFQGSARATEQLLLPGGERRAVVITSSRAEPDGAPGARTPLGDGRQFQLMRDETEVEASRRLRDAVLANVSHEFKTPLAAQLASLELLRDRLPELDPAEARQLVLSMERGTLRLTQLIDNLLESVRIDAGQDSIRRRDVALDEVVEEAVELTFPLIEQRKQRLSISLPHPLPHVTGDAPRLTQVFVNLLANANKFAPAGTEIRIGGSVSEDELRIWVEDEGPGLRPGAEKTVFDRFARAASPADPDDDDEPDQGGMGLGLWIVKSIVERHGGRVEVRRVPATASADAIGVRLCVVLPLSPDESRSDPAAERLLRGKAPGSVG